MSGADRVLFTGDDCSGEDGTLGTSDDGIDQLRVRVPAQQDPETQLRLRVALLAGRAVPAHGLGIVGLAWFSVTQRRKQIGTRRALGATRWDVVRYFMVEIGMVSGAGLVLGLVGTVALNWFLDTQYEVGRLPLWYLPAGALALWLLGQAAVLLPARRAANIPPALATRSI